MTETAAATIIEHELSECDRVNATGRTPVVFIHGLWLLPSSWDRWATLFEEAGFAPLDAGLAGRPRDGRRGANAHPEVFAGKSVGQVADHYDAIIRRARPQAGRHRPLVRRPADPDPRRAGPVGGVGRDRPGAVPRRAAAADLGAASRPSPVLRNPANRNRAVPLTYDQFRYAFANAVDEDEAKELYETYAVPAAGKPLFQAATANLNPWTEVKVDTDEPGARSAADHLRREGPHRAVGDRERVVQASRQDNAGRDRDRRDPGPRPLAHDRQRLARGRRDRPRVRPAVRRALT